MASKPRIKDVPEDFTLYAGKENDTQLGVRYGITRRQAARMRKNLGIQSTHPRVNPPKLPDDFAQIAASRNNVDVRRHYKVGEATVERWRKESGVEGPVTYQKHKPRPGAGSGQPYYRILTDTRPVGRMKFDNPEDMIAYARKRGMPEPFTFA
jgi:hypothetical protein